ncbi:hypothetical protein ACSSS7_001238 [Eimeria intestinalis]
MEVGGQITGGPTLAPPVNLVLEQQQSLHPDMMHLRTRNGEKKRLGNGRLVLHAALSLGLPACVAVAAVGPIDRLRILKQTRAALMLQQQQQQQQQHAALQQKTAARRFPFWLGAGCGSLTCLLACGTSVTALHFLRLRFWGRAAPLRWASVIQLTFRGLCFLRSFSGYTDGLAGLYCGLPWGLVSLIPYAGAAAWLHAPCLSLLSDLNQRLKGMRQNTTNTGGTHLSPNGELHASAHAFYANGDYAGAEAPENNAHACIPPTQHPPASVFLSAAYLTTRAAQVIAYPFDTIRRRMQVAAFCGVVGDAVAAGSSNARKPQFSLLADLWGLKHMPQNQRLHALRERTQRGLARVAYGAHHESAAAAAGAAAAPHKQQQQQLVLGPLQMIRSSGLHAASNPVCRGCWAGLPLLVIKTIPEGLVLLLTAKLLFPS